MTGVKFYLQAKLHGMSRFSGISVYGIRNPNYRLQRSKNWTSFFETEEAAQDIKNKLQSRYPQVSFKIKKDKGYGSTGYGWN
ncbi:hypothetical protein M3080_06380 [Parasutterella secunda]|uniref:hypothetical protein n=1 Tax=Parasutterella secunda TaxID=626947 RepID=UPI002011AD5E|nr:hypothetical protein [Parasutterella secunda]MCL1596985.1 hypothetical protein [Parasutterella secunda]MDM8088137.1 hypothetical protein [Parasutterella secunda]